MRNRLLNLLSALCFGLGLPGLALAHPAYMDSLERQRVWTGVVVGRYGLLAFVAVLIVAAVVMLVVRVFRKDGGGSRAGAGSQRKRPLSGGWAWMQALWALAFPIVAVVCIASPDLNGFFFFYNPMIFAATYVVRIMFWRRDVARIKEAGYTVGAWRFWGLLLSPLYLLFRAVRTDGKLRYFWLSLALYLLLGSPFILAMG